MTFKIWSSVLFENIKQTFQQRMLNIMQRVWEEKMRTLNLAPISNMIDWFTAHIVTAQIIETRAQKKFVLKENNWWKHYFWLTYYVRTFSLKCISFNENFKLLTGFLFMILCVATFFTWLLIRGSFAFFISSFMSCPCQTFWKKFVKLKFTN